MVRMEKFIRPSAAFFIAFFISVALNPGLAGAATITTGSVTSATVTSAARPLYLYIPSIKLFANIDGVGVNAKGNMDVPSSRTSDVGWYKYGTAPGQVGTAVIDAHNTAAFKTLHQVPVGADIYVYNSDGEWLRFVATAANTYSMQNLQSATLFEPTNNSVQKLNLITCAGTLLGNGEATHRLIVSAVLS
jgi:sortase (surface protein transpeptidase)